MEAPLTPRDQLRGLPLFETHAHLNGSIPPACVPAHLSNPGPVTHLQGPSAIAELVSRKSLEAGNEDLSTFALPSDLAAFDIHSCGPIPTPERKSP